MRRMMRRLDGMIGPNTQTGEAAGSNAVAVSVGT